LQTEGEPSEFGPPLHIHRDAAEAFYVLEGDYLMYVDDRQRLCPPGTFVYVPRGVPHTFKVVSAGPGKKLNLFSPAAMVGFFEDLAASRIGRDGHARTVGYDRCQKSHGRDRASAGHLSVMIRVPSGTTWRRVTRHRWRPLP